MRTGEPNKAAIVAEGLDGTSDTATAAPLRHLYGADLAPLG
jgi:hypothetical protein